MNSALSFHVRSIPSGVIARVPTPYQDANDRIVTSEALGAFVCRDEIDHLSVIPTRVIPNTTLIIRLNFPVGWIPTERFVAQAPMGEKLTGAVARETIYPGTAVAPVMTATKDKTLLLGCLDQRTCTLRSKETYLEIELTPKVGEVIRIADRTGTDCSTLLAGFRSSWTALVGSPSDPVCGSVMQRASCLLAIQLQDLEGDSAAVERTVRKLVGEHEGLAAAVYFWGQMSDYVGPAPPWNPGTGCCLPLMELRPRYQTWLPALARELADKGIYVGYYSNPSYTLPIQQWTAYNVIANDASAHYIDAIASCTPQQIAATKVLPLDHPLIEWPTLAMPGYAVMASGALWHGPTFPDGTPHTTSADPRITSWPEMGRLLFPAVKMFTGPQDGEWTSESAEPPHIFVYPGNRWAWRLGMGLMLQPQQARWGVNECVNEMLALWHVHQWFAREPFYRGVVKHSEPGLFITRFTDRTGKELYVFDQWETPIARTVMVNGNNISIPPSRLGISTL